MIKKKKRTNFEQWLEAQGLDLEKYSLPSSTDKDKEFYNKRTTQEEEKMMEFMVGINYSDE